MPVIPPAVRILPMSDKDPEFQGWGVQQVQEEFFLNRLPDRGGRFWYPTTGMVAASGTIVLFQYQKHVIACAELVEILPFAMPIVEAGETYQGEYRFAPHSIRVFAPMDAVSLRAFWPTFEGFGRVKQILSPPDAYPAFRQSLVNVRSVPMSLDDDEAEEDASGEYTPTGEDLRDLTLSQIRIRRGQHSFRELLRHQFNNCCAMTGCRTPAVLEAAHISRYLGDKDHHPTNGLLLRADVHTLFDLNLLGIKPDELKIEVHPKIADDYGFLAGRTLNCPTIQPSSAALEARYQDFQTELKSD